MPGCCYCFNDLPKIFRSKVLLFPGVLVAILIWLSWRVVVYEILKPYGLNFENSQVSEIKLAGGRALSLVKTGEVKFFGLRDMDPLLVGCSKLPRPTFIVVEHNCAAFAYLRVLPAPLLTIAFPKDATALDEYEKGEQKVAEKLGWLRIKIYDRDGIIANIDLAADKGSTSK